MCDCESQLPKGGGSLEPGVSLLSECETQLPGRGVKRLVTREGRIKASYLEGECRG